MIAVVIDAGANVNKSGMTSKPKMAMSDDQPPLFMAVIVLLSSSYTPSIFRNTSLLLKRITRNPREY